MSGKVYIVGVGSTALGRFPDQSVKQLTYAAVTQTRSSKPPGSPTRVRG